MSIDLPRELPYRLAAAFVASFPPLRKKNRRDASMCYYCQAQCPDSVWVSENAWFCAAQLDGLQFLLSRNTSTVSSCIESWIV